MNPQRPVEGGPPFPILGGTGAYANIRGYVNVRKHRDDGPTCGFPPPAVAQAERRDPGGAGSSASGTAPRPRLEQSQAARRCGTHLVLGPVRRRHNFSR